MTNLLLYQRIAQQLAEDIRRGVYQPGERVPSVRKMSSQLSVSHATMLQAYANLEDMGLIRARPQSGFYVHQQQQDQHGQPGKTFWPGKKPGFSS
jgi:DNA-binding GntR family transcriptional regulator